MRASQLSLQGKTRGITIKDGVRGVQKDIQRGGGVEGGYSEGYRRTTREIGRQERETW